MRVLNSLLLSLAKNLRVHNRLGLLLNVRPLLSTLDHIIRLQDTITRYQHNKQHVLAVFIDFEKAFDMVWRKGLLIKIKKKFGINGHMFAWIADLITDRTFQVRIGDEHSDIYILENGTSQGSIISPTLFLMMINDMPNSLSSTSVSLFADDSTFFKPGPNIIWLQRAVQKDLDVLQHWCNTWGFKISTEKTVGVLLTHSTNRPNIKIEVGGSPINIKHSARFLGMIFDKSLTWSEHIEYVINKCNKRLNLMRAVSGTR